MVTISAQHEQPSWLDALEARLVRSGATPDERLKKMILIIFLALAVIFFVGHALFFFLGGSNVAAALDLLGSVIAALFAVTMVRVNDPVPLWRAYTLFHFVLFFFINHSLGGLQNAQGSLIYVLFSPCCPLQLKDYVLP